jgi:type I restriction-modification system DNA methylase subunit
MGKEFFAYDGSRDLFKDLERLSQRSGVSRNQAFEDWLTAMVCALGHPLMEDEYMAMVERHQEGKQGKRGIDLMPQMFGNLTNVMTDTRADILGDIFQGAITYGEAGQFMTPEPVAQLMAKMTGERGFTVYDPCCGSGRMLLAVAQENRQRLLRVFIGQDIDLRCVKMTTLNLALNNLTGYVIWGNTLAAESKKAYETGFNGQNCVREIAPADCPAPVQRRVAEPPFTTSAPDRDESKLPETQRLLFDIDDSE